jgi:hypothetical protein
MLSVDKRSIWIGITGTWLALLVACGTPAEDDAFLRKPIKEQLRSAKTMEIERVYHLYNVSVETTGSTHLSKELSRRGRVINNLMLTRFSNSPKYVYPNRYMPIIKDTCQHTTYCQCEDVKFLNKLVNVLNKTSMYPPPGSSISQTPLGKFCASYDARIVPPKANLQ